MLLLLSGRADVDRGSQTIAPAGSLANFGGALSRRLAAPSLSRRLPSWYLAHQTANPGRLPGAIGLGACSWFPGSTVMVAAGAGDVVVRWSQFDGTSQALQFGINRCGVAEWIDVPWGSTQSHGGPDSFGSGFLVSDGLCASKIPGDVVACKVRPDALPVGFSFELVAVALGFYDGSIATSNRRLTVTVGGVVVGEHVIASIFNGQGFARLDVLGPSSVRVTLWN